MRMAIVADWLTTLGGAEQVILEFCDLFPEADIFTTVARPHVLGERTVHTTRLQTLYRLVGKHQLLLPFLPRAIESIDLRGYDVILSSSHAVGKGIVPPATALHICYCHTPMRYAWEMQEEYLSDFRVPEFLKPAARRMLTRLRRWDLTTAKRTDVFLANSMTTQERIKRIYNRESTVIHPPVHERFFAGELKQERKPYYFAIGRLVPYKRFDLLIEAANQFDFPLVIAGDGHDKPRLQKMAGENVTFLGRISQEELLKRYAETKAVLFPQFEDAGVVLLEAQASGTPVIAYKKGGALDIIDDGSNGVFFDEQKPRSLIEAIKKAQQISWNPQSIREGAKAYSSEKFRKHMQEAMQQAMYDDYIK